MGTNLDKDKYFMHIKFIGSNIENLYANFNSSEYLKNIKKLWDIDPPENKQVLSQIDDYFEQLNQLINSDNSKAYNLRECLIIKVDNLKSKEVNEVIEQMDNLTQTYKMPLVLFLTTQKSEKKSNIDKKDYSDIDFNLIFVKDYTEEKKEFEEKIAPILVRFCSIHNDLGDKFSLFDKPEDTFDLLEHAYSFNINIACIGSLGQGKSTGVNVILNEYRAKESNKGSSQTKLLVEYKSDNKPIRVIDIPGFENEKTVKDAIEKFADCGKVEKGLKDKIHIILYFMSYSITRAFTDLEFQMLEQITKHKSSKLIYVITRSKQNLSEKNKKKFFEKINSGLQGGAAKNEEIKNNLDMLKANDNNVVFVNFRADEEHPVIFGKKELFRKIYEFFIESESYKYFKENLNDEKLNAEIERLKSDAWYQLLQYKFWGGFVGIFPFVDIALQKLVINKKAIKKAAEIFKIDAKFVDEENEKEKKSEKKDEEEKKKKYEEEKKKLEEEKIKLEEEKKKLEQENNKEEENKNKNEPFYMREDIDKKNLITSVKGEELLSETKSNNATKIINNTIRAGTLVKEVNNFAKIYEYSSKIADLEKKMEFLEKAYATYTQNVGGLGLIFFDTAAHEAQHDALYYDYLALKDVGSGAKSLTKFLGIGTVISVGVGAYTTHKFCEDLINKFAEFYRKNASKISSSYEDAVSYFRDFKDE